MMTYTTAKNEETPTASGRVDTDYFDLHSPTDSSEDSVEVKITPICINKNKRKCAEPRKVPDSFQGPLKKRVCLKVKAEKSLTHPFRPWSPKPPEQYFRPPSPIYQEEPASSIYHEAPTSPIYQEEPVALVKRRDVVEEPPSPLRVPLHPQIATMSNPAEASRIIQSSCDSFPALGRREQRNYKNMTRERRIEANARERTRVHTISAAFDTLRKSIPSYSQNQKLSKLSVLRIACSYIMTLSSIVGDGDEEPATTECVDMVTKTIQREGKLRKKKDDND